MIVFNQGGFEAEYFFRLALPYNGRLHAGDTFGLVGQNDAVTERAVDFQSIGRAGVITALLRFDGDPVRAGGHHYFLRLPWE